LAISLLKDAKARVVGAATIARDITKRKRMEDELKKSHDELGILFRDLREKSENLEEVNIALKVLLKQRENDQKELAEMVLTNVRNLVLPYLGKLKRSQLSSAQSTLVEILELHLSEITSSFTKKLGIEAADLTPTQLRIAVLIRDGKSTSEIAEILCTSEKTIETHRGKIRKKLGLQGRRSNLMSHLQKI
jgi:DNA-binding CsgD family transcriptional regulator